MTDVRHDDPSTSDPAERPIPTRRISFKERLEGVPRHFAGDGDLIRSHIISVMSAVFPDGEDFFVRSVRHYRDEITDPDLLRDVKGFIGQEATHGREHRILNDHLATLGYPTKRIENFTKRGLAFRTRVASPASNLAATAALEHFTATLAEQVLADPRARAELGHPAIVELLTWHALEECEHKAVAFDVYRAVGGSERLRINTMKVIRFAFVTGTILDVSLSLLRDRDTWRRGRLRQSLRSLRTSSLVNPALWSKLCAYDRVGFHPNDIDTSDLVATWRTELFGDDGSLRDLLVGSAA